MAEIDVEKKDGKKGGGNTKWYVLAVIVILVIIVAWIAISDDSRANVDIPPEPVVLDDRTGTKNLM